MAAMDSVDESIVWPIVDPIKRLALWRTLLGVDATSNQLMNTRIENVVQDLPNQRVIRVDADRTRAAHPLFKTENMRERIRRIMTYYVKNRSVVYKQGLNELLPPFVLATAAGIAAKRAQSAGEAVPDTDDMGTQSVRSGSVERLAPDAVIYQCLERIVAKFVPKIYAEDDDFVSLQCSFRLFRLILQYHAPHLCTVLDQYDVPPELYATPWIITLFARMLSTRLVLPLWDFLLWHAAGRDTAGTRVPPPVWPQAPDVTWQPRSSTVPSPDSTKDAPPSPPSSAGSSESPPPASEPNAPCGPEILHFVAVAFLLSHSEQLLGLVRSGGVDVGMDLLGGVSRLAFRDLQHVQDVCMHAVQLYHASPSSLRDLLFVVCYAPGTKPTKALLARLEERVCAKLTIAEVLASSRALDVTAALEAATAPAPAAFAGAAAAHDAEIREEMERAAGKRGGGSGANSPPPPCAPFHVPPAPSYFLIDCRPLASFARGHLPTAFHLDPAALLDPERLQHITSALQELQGGPGGLHFAVLGEGRDDTQYYNLADEQSSSVFDRRSLQVPPDIAALSQGGTILTPEADLKPSSGKVRKLYLPKTWRKRRGGGDASDEGGASEGTDYSEDDVTKVVVLFLLQRGFKYVSEVQGGHTALVQFQGSALQHLLVESPGLLEEQRARARTGSSVGETGKPGSLASRLVASLFSPSVDVSSPETRPRRDSAAFSAAAAEGAHSTSSSNTTPLHAAADKPPSSDGGGSSSAEADSSAFSGARAAATIAGKLPLGNGLSPPHTGPSVSSHPLLADRGQGTARSRGHTTGHADEPALTGAYAALHRSRQLTHEAPLASGQRGRSSSSAGMLSRARVGSSAAPPASHNSAAPRPPPLYVPEDAYLEAQMDTLAGESLDTSPFVTAYSDLYSWMGGASHSGMCTPLGGASSTSPPSRGSKGGPSSATTGATGAPPRTDSPVSVSSDASGSSSKRGWGVLSRLRSALDKPKTHHHASAAAVAAAQVSAKQAALYRKDPLLGYLMGALPISDLKEHIHAGVLSGVAASHQGRKQLGEFGLQWSAADEHEVDAHQASDGSSCSGQAHALGCGAQLKLLPQPTAADAPPPPQLFACLYVPDNKTYASLQRAGAHEGDRLSSPALLPFRRFACVVGEELLLLRPRLCPVFAADALQLEEEEGGSSSDQTGREAVVGSVVVQLADQAASTAAGLSSPSDPPARMLLAVDLRWLDVQQRVPLRDITKRFLKSAVPGMMLVRWSAQQGSEGSEDSGQLAFVLDNLSAFEHCMEASLKRVRNKTS